MIILYDLDVLRSTMNDRVYMEEQTCHHTSKYAQNPMVTKLVRLVDISTKAMVV